MSQILEQLISILNVESSTNDKFIARNVNIGLPRVYGGQVLAQALFTASQTVDGMLPHSLHAYFLKLGDPKTPIHYEVDRIRDGKSFSTRRIVARQNDDAIFNMSCSYHKGEESKSHQRSTVEFPSGPEAYKSLETHRNEFAAAHPAFSHVANIPMPIEIRPVDFLGFFHPKKAEATSMAWVRANGTVPNDPVIHRGLLAFISDMGLLGTAARPHGFSLMEPSIMAASLDHSMWFHEDVNLNDWLLYVTDSPTMQSARGFTRGEFFTRDGRLVASTAQEGLIREKTR